MDRNGLRLGAWQGVFFVELDGPRRRRLWISSRGPAGNPHAAANR